MGVRVSEQKRWEYWNHFIACWCVEKIGGGHGVTGTKLRRIRQVILADDMFWFDIIHRHGADDVHPERLQQKVPEVYDHCLGNFWGMVYQTLVERGLVKP